MSHFGEVQAWLGKSDDELLLILGSALAADERHVFPQPPRKLIADASSWLSANSAKCRHALCMNAKVRMYASMPASQFLFDAACEAIVHITAKLPAGCVVAHIIRVGINKVCAEHWSGEVPESKS